MLALRIGRPRHGYDSHIRSPDQFWPASGPTRVRLPNCHAGRRLAGPARAGHRGAARNRVDGGSAVLRDGAALTCSGRGRRARRAGRRADGRDACAGHLVNRADSRDVVREEVKGKSWQTKRSSGRYIRKSEHCANRSNHRRFDSGAGTPLGACLEGSRRAPAKSTLGDVPGSDDWGRRRGEEWHEEVHGLRWIA